MARPPPSSGPDDHAPAEAPEPRPSALAQKSQTCPECGHSWEAHDDLGCSASIMPETATWAGQETWCDCERARPKGENEGGTAA